MDPENVKVVHSLAKKYSRGLRRQLFEDMVQDGFEGLMKAAQKNDPSLGCKLSTYADYWIRAHIGDGKLNLINIVPVGSRSTGCLIGNVRNAETKISTLRGETPKPEEIAEELRIKYKDRKTPIDLSPEKIEYLRTLGKRSDLSLMRL